MYYLKKIEIKNVAIFSFVIAFTIASIVCLPFIGISFLFTNEIVKPQTEAAMIPNHIVKYFLVIAPFFYGIIAAIMNSLIVLAYNLLAKKIDGIKIELAQIPNTQLSPAPDSFKSSDE